MMMSISITCQGNRVHELFSFEYQAALGIANARYVHSCCHYDIIGGVAVDGSRWYIIN